MMTSPTYRGRAFALAALLWTCVPALSAQAEASGARAELRRADQLVEDAKGLRGPALTEALTRAADAYRQVVASHGDDKASCARAWFEIGELERRQAHLAEAEQAYARSAELDFERFGARALIQQAHMQRRLDRPDEALAVYRKVAEIEPDSARAHTARLWIAKCLQAKGDLTGAIEAYESALGATAKPARAIELCNGLAKVHLAQGDLEAAGDAIARAEKLVPAGDGEEAQKLRKAVEKMSARKALQRARDKASGAHEDARELEREKGREKGRKG